MKPQLEEQLRKLGNSMGLWIMLFAGFGLLSLSLGEEKIQRRMFRNHMRMHYQLNPASEPTSTGHVESTDASNSVNDSGMVLAAQPYQYRLVGLRWMLVVLVVAGFTLIVFELRWGRRLGGKAEE